MEVLAKRGLVGEIEGRWLKMVTKGDEMSKMINFLRVEWGKNLR